MTGFEPAPHGGNPISGSEGLRATITLHPHNVTYQTKDITAQIPSQTLVDTNVRNPVMFICLILKEDYLLEVSHTKTITTLSINI